MTTKSIALETSNLEAPKRYHPALASFHWVIALLVVTDIFLALAPEGPGGLIPRTIFGLSIVGYHMVIGTAILVLLAFRLVIRLATRDPEPVTAGHVLLDKFAVLTHYSLYLFTFLITLSGFVMSAQRGYFAQLFGIGSVPKVFPQGSYLWGALHGLSWTFLGLFLFIHTAAALYHQFLLKDKLFTRMWFGK